MKSPSSHLLPVLFAVAALCAAAAPQDAAVRKPEADFSSYSVVALGDLHYDDEQPERFHAEFIKKNGGRVSPNFLRNAKMWAGPSRRMLEASAKCVGPDAAFVLQLGDIIHGDCESDTVHTQYLAEAISVLEATYPGLPIVPVAGNHDVRSGLKLHGATAAYCQFMLPFLTHQLSGLVSNGVDKTTFGFRLGPDLWIIADFNVGVRDLAVIKKLLDDNGDARYTFVCSHGPVLPSDISSKNRSRRWFFLGSADYDKQRREMRALFAKRNVIVLCGHLHALEYKDWFGDGGRITEMVLTSVLTRTEAEPSVVFDSPDRYGDWPPNAATNAATTALFAEYKPGLKERYAARAGGHYMLHVSDSGVTLDYYGLEATKPTKTFVLR